MMLRDHIAQLKAGTRVELFISLAALIIALDKRGGVLREIRRELETPNDIPRRRHSLIGRINEALADGDVPAPDIDPQLHDAVVTALQHLTMAVIRERKQRQQVQQLEDASGGEMRVSIDLMALSRLNALECDTDVMLQRADRVLNLVENESGVVR